MRVIKQPKLRFYNYSNNWMLCNLKSLSELITKGTTPISFSNSGINFVKIESLIDTKIIEDKCGYISNETHNKELKRSILNEGDILFAIAGATIGKVGVVSTDILPANTNQALAIVRLLNNQNLLFVLNVLQSTIMKKYIKKNISVGAQPNLNLNQIGSFCFRIPCLKEQQQIATFLTSVDSKIDQLTEKYRLLKEYKKGVMQQIFSQQLRFKDEDGKAFPEWESMSLDDVLLLQSDSLKMKDNESYELITVKRRFGGITSRGNYLGKDVLVKNQFTIHEDEFVISKRQIVHGACGLVPKELEGAIVSNEYNVFRPIADKLDLDYFNRFSTTPYMRRSYFINSDGVHIEKLLFKTQSWLKTKVDLPCLKEQQKIAQFLQSIDKKTDAVAQQVEQTKQFKKGLLQQMFV